MINIICVRAGTKYGIEYVANLRRMVAEHLPQEHRFICLSDQPERVPGIKFIDISSWCDWRLYGWWAKMLVFLFQSTQKWGHSPTLFLDLDTVIVGDLTPLATLPTDFSICENFTRLAGNTDWPCRYGSCVMWLPPRFGNYIWRTFHNDMHGWIQRCPRGDQQAIEQIYPNATYLQNILPTGYLLGRRDFSDSPPPEAAVMIFAGSEKPHNTKWKWLHETWTGAHA